MANGFFTSIGTQILQGTYDFSTDVVSDSLIDAGTVTPNQGTHDFYNDIESAEIATGALDTLDTTGGAFDSADEVHATVSGNSVENVDVWINTGGASSTDPLVADYDTGTGLPVTPNGGNITVSPNASGWFAVI